MKNTCILFLLLGSFFACKKNTSKNPVQPSNKPIVQINSTENDTIKPIKIYSILIDSANAKFSKEFLFLSEKLSKPFKDDSKTKNPHDFQLELKYMEENVFAKKLAEDFKNTNFIKVKNILISFLKKDKHTSISLEEWQFESEKEATSCMNSLKKYESVTIHFKAFNWIWIQQKNKLYLVSSIQDRPFTEPMQTVKQNLIDILKKQGEYSIIEIY